MHCEVCDFDEKLDGTRTNKKRTVQQDKRTGQFLCSVCRKIIKDSISSTTTSSLGYGLNTPKNDQYYNRRLSEIEAYLKGIRDDPGSPGPTDVEGRPDPR